MPVSRWMLPLVFALASVVRPETRAAEKDASASLAELEQLAKDAGIDLDLPKWDVSGFLETGVGYNDNVLLRGRVIDTSSGAPVIVIAPDSSSLVRAEFNVLAWRLPQRGFDWFATIDITSSRFFSAETDAAHLVIGRAEAHWEPRDPLRFSLAGQYIYDDEVIDTSNDDVGSGSLQAKFGTLSLEPAVRWKFAENWSAFLKFDGASNDYRAPLYDYREYSSELAIARNFGRWGEVTLAWEQSDRRYDDRRQVTAGGRPIDGTKLAFAAGSGEVRYEIRGGEELKWRARLKASYVENRDNYEGYYDYDRRGVQADWSCEGEKWRFEADVAWRGFDYRIQTVGTGNPPRRHRDGWSGSARFERDLREGLAVFVEVSAERSLGNDLYNFLDYRGVVSVLGLRWSR